jgi:hypothetical protein
MGEAAMSALVPLLAAWIVLVVVVLRAMAIAKRADAMADRQWEELARLRSASGVAFFPTRSSRRELELAIRDLIGAAL